MKSTLYTYSHLEPNSRQDYELLKRVITDKEHAVSALIYIEWFFDNKAKFTPEKRDEIFYLIQANANRINKQIKKYTQ